MDFTVLLKEDESKGRRVSVCSWVQNSNFLFKVPYQVILILAFTSKSACQSSASINNSPTPWILALSLNILEPEDLFSPNTIQQYSFMSPNSEYFKTIQCADLGLQASTPTTDYILSIRFKLLLHKTSILLKVTWTVSILHFSPSVLCLLLCDTWYMWIFHTFDSLCVNSNSSVTVWEPHGNHKICFAYIDF